jgi:hypothetical protein
MGTATGRFADFPAPGIKPPANKKGPHCFADAVPFFSGLLPIGYPRTLQI